VAVSLQKRCRSSRQHDARALHLKIDELLRTSRARDWLVQLEDLPDEELDRVHKEFERLISQRQRVDPQKDGGQRRSVETSQ
jgi:low affinity Fe/Cu permease